MVRIVESSPGLADQHDLFLARVVAQPKYDIVLVRVINPSPAPPATKKHKQTKPLVSEQFDLDGMNLSSPLRKELDSLLDVFSSGPADLGRTGIVHHRVDAGDHPRWSRDCDLALRVQPLC